MTIHHDILYILLWIWFEFKTCPQRHIKALNLHTISAIYVLFFYSDQPQWRDGVEKKGGTVSEREENLNKEESGEEFKKQDEI